MNLGGGPFKDFIESNKKTMRYNSYFSKSMGSPYLFIKGTEKVVGTCFDSLNGKIVFIPNVLDAEVEVSDDERMQAEEVFIESIVKLDSALKSKVESEILPEWSNNYLLPDEHEEKGKLMELQKQIELLESRIIDQRQAIKDIEEYKILFTGTGTPLEQIIKKIFIELGFEATEGLPGRDDLILKYMDKVAVVEVKGVTKSAAEKHAAQLEKWVSGYIEKYGVSPKGMLIVNSFCNLPLTERVEETFPHQMLSYSEKREHVLLNTLQLLGAFIDIRKKPEIKESVIEDLFSTNGTYNSYNNWFEFLDHTAL